MYSQGMCRPITEVVCAGFPRELRDLVWEHVLGNNRWNVMARKVEKYLHRTLKAPYIDPLGDDAWIVQPFFVGRQAAREILEPVYKKTFKDYECKDMSLLRALSTVDAFSAGLTPLPSFVKKLELFGTMGSCGGASTDAGRFHSQESWEQGFELLRRLPETELCELKVRIVDIGTDNIGC
jgi:hypothetical protein